MQVLENIVCSFLKVFEGDNIALITFLLSTCALLLSAVLGFVLHAISVYGALAAIVLGAFWIVGKIKGFSLSVAGTCLAVLAVLGGVIYLIGYIVQSIEKAVKKRRAARAEIERRLQYTLPDKDNSFVRARLNTVLHVDGPPTVERTEKTENVLSLSHAQRLLARLREMQLSTADRLETEEMSRLLSAYVKKDSLSTSDMRTVNDTLAYLLKLSAKYSL